MNRFVFASLMTSWALTMAGLAPAMAASHGAVREPERHIVRVVRTPAPTWTCAHNAYRSVVCS